MLFKRKRIIDEITGKETYFYTEKEIKLRESLKRIFFIGLSGNGKSTKLVGFLTKLVKNKKRVLYLTFNSNYRHEIERKIAKEDNNDYSEIHTFHSLCYKHLRHILDQKIKNLPDKEKKEIFKDKLPYYFPNQFKERDWTSEFFNKLFDWFIEEFENIFKIQCDAIICDGIEVLRPKSLEILELIIQKNPNVEIYSAGNPMQSIFWNYMKKEKAPSIFQYFQKQVNSRIFRSNINYRFSNGIKVFLNGYYDFVSTKFNLQIPKYNLDNNNLNQSYDDVQIFNFDNQDSVLNKIIELRTEYSGKNIHILYKTKEQEVLIETYNRDNHIKRDKKVTYSTFHKMISGESDVVIIVNTHFGNIDKLEDAMIWNLGMTRAKEKLIILSTFPTEQTKTYFKEGTYKLINNQNNFILKPLPILDNNIYLVFDKVNQNYLDRIDIKLPIKQLPYIPQIVNDPKLNPVNKYESIIEDNINHVIFTIRKEKKNIHFRFSNLSIFKNNNYSDIQILDYCKDIIYNFFHGLISEDIINNSELSKLDLCKNFLLESDYINIRDTVKNIFTYFSKYSHNIAINKIYLHENTFYFNINKRRDKVIAVYSPSDKDNENKVHTDNVFKIESRMKNNKLKFTFKHLYTLTQENKLESLLKESIHQELVKDINKPFKKDINNLIRKRLKRDLSILSLDKLKDSRDKRVLFNKFLSDLKDKTLRSDICSVLMINNNLIK